MPFFKNLGSFGTLKNIIARLRSPRGCPWDRRQTHASLKAGLLEECYEVLQALDQENSEKLCEELGDLLMQIVLHAQIASEAGKFNVADVLRGINTKLIHRHPHVFGELKLRSAQEVVLNWESLKREERREGESLLAGVPGEMPALAYSQAVQRRVATAGFDWEEVDGVIDKLVEEVAEFKQADDEEEKAREFGDLLFTLANIARKLGIDLEAALRSANQRFYRRFVYMEGVCRQQGINFDNLSFAQQNALWEEAKQKVK